MHTTNDLHIRETRPVIAPAQLKQRLPLGERAAATVASTRDVVRAIIHGRDRRRLAIVGPCSIHDVAAARDYGARLKRISDRLSDDLVVIMRVYFEKPRTTTGWKGLINDPHLDGTFAVDDGLHSARSLLLDLAEQGVPAATELLDPVVPQYVADLVTWTAIGARTTESQTHREMASGLSMPVGFKNGTDGSLTVAVNAMVSAASSHHFLGIDADGRVAVVRTSGNPDTHVVLRGGRSGPNYGSAAVIAAEAHLRKAGQTPRVLVDCSHDNSSKDHARQVAVLSDIASQLATGDGAILGVMVESHLVGGRQDFRPGQALTYGQSITDACIDLATTERMLEELAGSVPRRAVAV